MPVGPLLQRSMVLNINAILKIHSIKGNQSEITFASINGLQNKGNDD